MVYKWRRFFHIAGPCLLCGAQTSDPTRLCEPCVFGLPWNLGACRQCAAPLPHDQADQLCAHCLRDPPPFEHAVAALRFEPPTDTLVRRFKHGNLAAGRGLARLLAMAVAADEPSAPLVPLPLDPTRLRQRGFDQMQEICRELGDTLATPVLNLLRRSRPVSDQRGLSKVQRRRNVRGSFVCTEQPPARVILVDDVMTTGATLAEASRCLLTAGAEKVEVWVVARTP